MLRSGATTVAGCRVLATDVAVAQPRLPILTTWLTGGAAPRIYRRSWRTSSPGLTFKNAALSLTKLFRLARARRSACRKPREYRRPSYRRSRRRGLRALNHRPSDVYAGCRLGRGLDRGYELCRGLAAWRRRELHATAARPVASTTTSPALRMNRKTTTASRISRRGTVQRRWQATALRLRPRIPDMSRSRTMWRPMTRCCLVTLDALTP
jgi:hypothetical protein